MNQQTIRFLACPRCHGPLVEGERGLDCGGCVKSFPVREGIACFSATDTFYGELPKAEMEEFLRLAESTHWASATESFLPGRNPGLIDTIRSPKRAAWLRLLDLDRRETVLDYGCGLGGVSVPLTSEFRDVVALDGTFERIRFLQIRKRQDGLSNLHLVCNGDVVRLPFPDGAFDLVVLNMVFPYLHAMVPGLSGSRAELAALSELRRVVAPSGCLYVTVRNRFGVNRVSAWARALSRGGRLENADNYLARSYLHHRRLLREAGFGTIRSFWLHPNYKFPDAMVPLDEGAAGASRGAGGVQGLSPLQRGFFRTAGLFGLLPHVVETCAFLAYAPGKPR